MNIKKCTNVSGRALQLREKAHCGKLAHAIQKPNGERVLLTRNVRARETQL